MLFGLLSPASISARMMLPWKLATSAIGVAPDQV